MRASIAAWGRLARCVVMVLVSGLLAQLAYAQETANTLGAAPDTTGVLNKFGHLLVDHFGTVGLVISVVFFGWLLYKIRLYERSRRSD